jgi:predicted phage terminase large subunit-like protein
MLDVTMNPARRAELIEFIRHGEEQERRAAKVLMSERGRYDDDGVWVGGLYAFIERYWRVLEPDTPFVGGWALEAMCQHLEAVTFGEIKRLLMNVPPGFMKSLLTDVFWPAWEWGPMNRAHLRYVAFSYSSSLTERDNDKFTVLLSSPEYQVDWGDRVKLRQTGQKVVSNKKHGRKLSSSIGGVGTGERGNRVIFDDPHSVKDDKSEGVREETVRWFREAMSNRLNDIKRDAIVIIMQRVHEGDVSGTILDNEMDYVHLMIPMEFDWERVTDEATGEPIPNAYGWVDPRWQPNAEDCDGELAWPERFPEEEVQKLKRDVGSYAWAGQYQQTPKARGAQIIMPEYWQMWESSDGRFPPFEFIVGSLDSAFSKKKENDPSALTVWGIFRNEHGHRRIMLIHAWRRRLRLNGAMPPKSPKETLLAYRQRSQKHWGMVQWVADTCDRFKVDMLLIENKANGSDVADEIARQFPRKRWGLHMVNPTQDKIARAWSVQPTWANGMIFAPDREWAQMVIDEMEVFPKGKHDDLTDSATQAISHLRKIGLAETDEEAIADETESVVHRPQRKSLASHYQGMS